jgi:hypothetical protein
MERNSSRPIALIKTWYFWLILITTLAIILRSIPAWTNAAWGSDFGIYYGLTKAFLTSGNLINTYNGWGGTYQYFPILYIITGAAHMVTGLDLLSIMPKIAPIFGGLTVLILYYIVYTLLKRRDIALLSAAFLAVAPFHVYQTSHAAPLTMGHFFMLLSLYLYLKYLQNHRYLLPLIASTILLIMSHHLTTYFYLITLLGITLIQSINTPRHDLKRQIIYVSTCSMMAFIYWFTVAVPVFNVYLGRTILGSPWALVLLYYLAFFGILLTFTNPKIQAWHQTQAQKKSRAASQKRAGILFIGTISVLLSVILVFFFIPFPVSILRMNTTTLLYSIPVIIFCGLSILGFEYLRELEHRKIIQGWFFAIFISFLFAFLTGDENLFPDRHIEYLMVPMSIIAAYGLYRFFNNRIRVPSLPTLSLKRFPHRQWLFVSIAVFVILTNGMAVYPAKNSIGGINETISEPSLAAIQWMDDSLNKNTTMVASDLRLAKIAWADGFNTTFETTNEMWYCAHWHDCLQELKGNQTRGKITTIIIDDVMKTSVVNLALLRNVYMTNASYLKFSSEPFTLLYRNETTTSDGKVLHWVEVYEVNWTFIESYVPPKHNFF